MMQSAGLRTSAKPSVFGRRWTAGRKSAGPTRSVLKAASGMKRKGLSRLPLTRTRYPPTVSTSSEPVRNNVVNPFEASAYPPRSG